MHVVNAAISLWDFAVHSSDTKGYYLVKSEQQIPQNAYEDDQDQYQDLKINLPKYCYVEQSSIFFNNNQVKLLVARDMSYKVESFKVMHMRERMMQFTEDVSSDLDGLAHFT